MKFLNLLTDELKRSRFFYFFLISGVVGLETLGVGYTLFSARQALRDGNDVFHSLNSLFDSSVYYGLIVGGAAFSLIIYAIFIWTKEWYFQGNYIYRLLILPGNRAPIAFAKVTAIIMLMAGVLMIQLVIFYVTNWIASAVLPDNYLIQPVLLQLAQTMGISYTLLPLNPITTLLFYSFGLSFLMILMNNCILILSHRGHGLIKTATITIIYDVIMIAILVGIVLFSQNPFTQSELLIVLFVCVILYGVANGGLMYWLMNRYISV